MAGIEAEETAGGTPGAARPRARTAARTPAPRAAVLVVAGAAAIALAAALPDMTTGFAVPFSLQSFAVLLAGACLGPLRGFLAVLLYLAAGALGLPVFAGGAGGLEHLAGPSAGYLAAFPLAAATCGFLVARRPGRAVDFAFVFTAGLLSSFLWIHSLGPLVLAARAGLELREALLLDARFYPGDILKNLAMAWVATRLHRRYPGLLGGASRG